MNQPIRNENTIELEQNTDQSNDAIMTHHDSSTNDEIHKEPIRSPEIEERIPINGSEISSMFSGLYCTDIPGDAQDRMSSTNQIFF